MYITGTNVITCRDTYPFHPHLSSLILGSLWFYWNPFHLRQLKEGVSLHPDSYVPNLPLLWEPGFQSVQTYSSSYQFTVSVCENIKNVCPVVVHTHRDTNTGKPLRISEDKIIYLHTHTYCRINSFLTMHTNIKINICYYYICSVAHPIKITSSSKPALPMNNEHKKNLRFSRVITSFKVSVII